MTTVLAVGGGGFGYDDRGAPSAGPLVRHALALTGAARPRICGLLTAAGDAPERLAVFYAGVAGLDVRASHLAVFPMPTVPDVAAHLRAQDLVWVGGGSVANLLALWRVHGVDDALRAAGAAGTVLAGVSAGALCWHTGGTTDSFGSALGPITDGLGLVPGSHSPQYDSEERRRPLYQRLVADGTLDPGIAADDGVGLHYVDGSLVEAVADRDGAAGWRVDRGPGGTAVEIRIEPRQL